MSELTNEKLEEYARDGRNAGDCEVEQLARELLTLRTLRDAGDEEVERLRHTIADLGPSLAGEADRLHDIAITRGQQLREIRESCPCNCHNQPSSKEAMGLDEHSNCGECIKGLLQEADAMQDSLCEKYESELREAREEIERARANELAACDSLVNEHNRLTEQIVTLTTERDEARSKLEKQIDITYEAKAVVSQMQKELAALKACPAMAEVDALEKKWNGPLLIDDEGLVIGEIFSALRRSISSREVVIEGLLAVESLILESKGVAGLHLNGDLAEWDELRSGGRFGDWLYKFDDALEIVKGK